GRVIGRGRLTDRGKSRVVERGDDLVEAGLVETDEGARGFGRLDEQRQNALAILFDQKRKNGRDIGRESLLDDLPQLRGGAVTQQLGQQLLIRTRTRGLRGLSCDGRFHRRHRNATRINRL